MKLIQDHKERYEDKRNEITKLRKVYQVDSVNSTFVWLKLQLDQGEKETERLRLKISVSRLGCRHSFNFDSLGRNSLNFLRQIRKFFVTFRCFYGEIIHRKLVRYFMIFADVNTNNYVSSLSLWNINILRPKVSKSEEFFLRSFVNFHDDWLHLRIQIYSVD